MLITMGFTIITPQLPGTFIFLSNREIKYFFKNKSIKKKNPLAFRIISPRDSFIPDKPFKYIRILTFKIFFS